MLIEHFDLEILTPPCDPGAERYTAVARLKADISEALPYLNATLSGADYHPEANALIWKTGDHTVAFHSYEIALSNLADRSAAQSAVQEVVYLANQTWERRGEIKPNRSTRKRPTPLAIYRLLPQTSCRLCGEPTCFTFAAKLAVGQKTPADCHPLLEAAHAERLAALMTVLAGAPAAG